MDGTVLADWDNSLRAGFSVRDWMIHLADFEAIEHEWVDRLADAFEQHREGVISYEELARAAAGTYAASLTGQSASLIRRQAQDFVQNDGRLFDFTEDVLRALERIGPIIVVSGCPQELLEAYKRVLPIEVCVGLRCGVRGNRYTGTTRANPAVASSKAYFAGKYLDGEMAALAIGDSLSDLPLFLRATHRLIVAGEHGSDLDLAHSARIGPDTSGPRAVELVEELLSAKGASE